MITAVSCYLNLDPLWRAWCDYFIGGRYTDNGHCPEVITIAMLLDTPRASWLKAKLVLIANGGETRRVICLMSAHRLIFRRVPDLNLERLIGWQAASCLPRKTRATVSIPTLAEWIESQLRYHHCRCYRCRTSGQDRRRCRRWQCGDFHRRCHG